MGGAKSDLQRYPNIPITFFGSITSKFKNFNKLVKSPGGAKYQ